MLPDGIIRVGHEKKHSYLLPLDKAPTGNNQPIFIECSGTEKLRLKQPEYSGSCSTAYQHPNGLIFDYGLGRSSVPENSLISTDQKMRKKMEELIINTSHNENKDGL